MTGVELVGLVSSGVSIGQILSKFFLPPEAVDPQVEMEYVAEPGVLSYKASFQIPHIKQLRIVRRLRREKSPNVQFKCAEGFLIMQARLETEVDSKEIVVPCLHFCLPSIFGEKELRALSGQRVFVKAAISIDLRNRIKAEWFPLEPDSKHLKGKVTNTMDIEVKEFNFTGKLPQGRKLKKATLIQDGFPRLAPVILNHNVQLYCSSGDLGQEFPGVNTSNISWISDDQVNGTSEVAVPVESIGANREIIVELLFE